jgi:hypothetical protein
MANSFAEIMSILYHKPLNYSFNMTNKLKRKRQISKLLINLGRVVFPRFDKIFLTKYFSGIDIFASHRSSMINSLG